MSAELRIRAVSSTGPTPSVNYRHHYHAGNFADVVKHVLLGALLRGMAKKEKGFLFLDTHAGRGRYDLSRADQGDSLARQPEWPEGIGRLLDRTDLPLGIAEYVEAVRAFDRRAGNLSSQVRFYPGSPWLARGWSRPQDRLLLCELQPGEQTVLSTEFAKERRVSVQLADGYRLLRGALPPPERRALVLIDPPFESSTEWTDVVDAVEAALGRMPSVTLAIWYPLTERARVDRFAEHLERLRPPPTWAAELTIAGERAGFKMNGCGVVVINPPWQLDREADGLLQWLAPVLARGEGGRAQLTWIVPERE